MVNSSAMRAVTLGATVLVGCGDVTGPGRGADATAPPPPNLFATETGGLRSRLAMSAGGVVVVLWSDGGRVWASDSVDGLSWPAPVQFPRHPDALGTSLEHAVELDERGDGFAAWLESTRSNGVAVVACRYRAGFGWSPPVEVARGAWVGINDLALAVAPSGAAALAWGGTEGVLASAWSGQGWSAPERLSEPQFLVNVGDLALRLRGRTGAAVWSEDVQGLPSEIHTRVRARVWDAEAGWQPQAELARSLRRPMPLARPAVDSVGTATFLWGGGPDRGPFLAQTVRHDPTRGWEPLETLGEYEEVVGLEAHAGDQLTAVLGNVPFGSGSLTALRRTHGVGWRVLGLTPSLGGTASLSYSAQAANAPQVALVAPDGSLWLARPGSPWVRERVPFDTRPCDAIFPTVHDPRVAMDASGATFVTWLSNCRGESLFSWRRPGPGP